MSIGPGWGIGNGAFSDLDREAAGRYHDHAMRCGGGGHYYPAWDDLPAAEKDQWRAMAQGTGTE